MLSTVPFSVHRLIVVRAYTRFFRLFIVIEYEDVTVGISQILNDKMSFERALIHTRPQIS